jgi:glycosyltransferase involved in cell wall biosynthesis
MNAKVSLIVCAHEMPRELPRTIQSLSPGMQKGIGRDDYEIIVVDNGSTKPFDEVLCRSWGADISVLRFASESPSPARALNAGIWAARGELVGVLIDGARLGSPGLVAQAATAARLAERPVILTLGFHLGSEVQVKSVLKGYNQDEEDRLLERSGWTEDGYRLFNISVFAGSSAQGWFRPLAESNAIFLPRGMWEELGGFDERFQTPGGGLVNLDTLARAVALRGAVVVTLLGEGTFHQVHGGVATNAVDSIQHIFRAEYQAIKGKSYRRPDYRSLYFGLVPATSLPFIAISAQTGVLVPAG